MDIYRPLTRLVTLILLLFILLVGISRIVLAAPTDRMNERHIIKPVPWYQDERSHPQIVSGLELSATPGMISPSANSTDTYSIFLPLLLKYQPPAVKLSVDFGLFMNQDAEMLERDLPLAKEMGADGARVWLSWAAVEATPGQYNWETYDIIFARLQEVGLKPLPVIYNIPAWAAEEGCGPISDTLALEAFLEVTLARYGSIVDAWEFINEPDGREPYLPFGPIIGCWGLQPEKYATQLGIFYNKVKTLDPEALVLFGGLAYDNWVVFERGFFENTLKNGAGQFFDVLSLHYYPINPDDFPTMAAKVNEIRDIMSRNNVAGKRIWITETSMWANGSEGLEGQLNFIVEELSRGFCAGVDNMFWFAVRQEPVDPLSFRWLINRNHEPDNGYYTFQHLARKLENMSCMGPYKDVPQDVEAYQFGASGRLLYILWSNTTPKLVTIPTSVDATLIDRDGNILSILPTQNNQVTFEVGAKAVFLEITE